MDWRRRKAVLPTRRRGAGDGGDLLPYDGKITGYIPEDGEDMALWHMEMGDGDDES